MTSDISQAAKSDDWSPLLVSTTTVPKAALSRPSSRPQCLRVDLGGLLDRRRAGQDVQARGVPGHRPLEQGLVEPLEVLEDGVEGIVRDDVEHGVDRAEDEVEVDEDGLAVLGGGQGRRQVDGDRGHADAAGGARDGDDLRPPASAEACDLLRGRGTAGR